jgi:hypothetical protein
MFEFVLRQKWIMADAVFGTFMAEVIELSDSGGSGAVLIIDDGGNEVDTFTGTAAEFQASGNGGFLKTLGSRPEPLKLLKGCNGVT